MTPGLWRTREDQAAVWPGQNSPLGSTWSKECTNFAVWAPEATAVWVCLFDEDRAEHRHRLTERSLGIWHGAIPGVGVGARYGYRVAGSWAPAQGLRFNPAKLLLDPYARAVSGELKQDPAIFGYLVGAAEERSSLDSADCVPLSVVVDDHFDWQGEQPLRRRWRDTVIYELHVRGMTRLHDQVPPDLRGTYAGLATPAVTGYLRDLGVTAVELLPIHQFCTEPAVEARGLVNYWGYNSIGFFAPHAAYSSAGDRGQQVTEFKLMVKAFHDAGLEVLLDVVFNHTAEGGVTGPTLCFRGLDDKVYHRATPGPAGTGFQDTYWDTYWDSYWDVTGCGNTLDAAHPFALRLILDSLRYWVTEMHVDGFRFDLLSALTRVGQRVDMSSHLLTAIGQDPVLRHAKLIAEPWDASMDGYQVGEFPPPWIEWNDQFRDEIRDFWRGRTAGIRTVATRLAGSSDLYADDGRSPYASVNYVSAHDGFTVRDLVSYDHKHNEPNGEDNRDGTNDNRSWNRGVEGETSDPAILALRRRVAANVMATLCLSSGVPMIAAGDERGRTQHGNNNAYCQDNDVSWINWRPEDAWLDVYAITKAALRLRREHPALRQRHHFEGRPTIRGGPKDLAWLHPSGREMSDGDWHDTTLPAVGMFVSGAPLREPGPRGEQQVDASFMLWLNSGDQPLRIELPQNGWLDAGEVVLSTDARLPVGTPVKAGDRLALGGQTVVVMMQT